MRDMTHHFLCIHGHFYQPPREDPFTGRIAPEFGAAPFENFNEKITAECYRPNAEAGNFERISFDLGPTLAAWMAEHHPDVLARIVAADRASAARHGVGNAMAQAYNHTILPLAASRDKRTQIAWGLADFERRFGRKADGMWLAETAVDLESLAILAEFGVTYTVLAPWQAAEPIDPTEPYLVRLPGGRSIAVFFYNGPLSGAVSFDPGATSNGDAFVESYLPPQSSAAKRERREDQLMIVATDGELYGHHKPWRDQFLTYVVREAAPARGFAVVSLGRYLRDHLPTREVRIHSPSAWSCAHGVDRWNAGCGCTEGEAGWKPELRAALDRLSARLNAEFEGHASATLRDPWAARDGYIALRNKWITQEEFFARHGARRRWFRNRALEAKTVQLLEAQYFGQYMYTSCGWFFEDLDRIEPRNDIAFARRAIGLMWQATGVDLQAAFVADLANARSWRTARTGAELYMQLPRVKPDELPALAVDADEAVA